MLPPINVKDYIVLAREPGSTFMTVFLSNQDSYEMESEEARTYLKLLGVDEDSEHIVDYIWSFGGCKLHLLGMEREHMSFEQAMKYGKITSSVMF